MRKIREGGKGTKKKIKEKEKSSREEDTKSFHVKFQLAFFI
jgi:hypothetical protein